MGFMKITVRVFKILAIRSKAWKRKKDRIKQIRKHHGCRQKKRGFGGYLQRKKMKQNHFERFKFLNILFFLIENM